MTFESEPSVKVEQIQSGSYFSIGNGQPGEPALCQLYRHTFVPDRLADDSSTMHRDAYMPPASLHQTRPIVTCVAWSVGHEREPCKNVMYFPFCG